MVEEFRAAKFPADSTTATSPGTEIWVQEASTWFQIQTTSDPMAAKLPAEPTISDRPLTLWAVLQLESCASQTCTELPDWAAKFPSEATTSPRLAIAPESLQPLPAPSQIQTWLLPMAAQLPPEPRISESPEIVSGVPTTLEVCASHAYPWVELRAQKFPAWAEIAGQTPRTSEIVRTAEAAPGPGPSRPGAFR